MGSILSASLKCVFPVHTIWSDRGDEDGGLSGKIPHFCIVEVAYFDGYTAVLIFVCIAEPARAV